MGKNTRERQRRAANNNSTLDSSESKSEVQNSSATSSRALRNRREVRQQQSVSMSGIPGGPQVPQGKVPFESWLTTIRQRILTLGTSVATYEECVNIQNTPKEDVQARVAHAKKREELRRECVSIQEDLMGRMAEGTTEERRNIFFTECFNYTNSVDRFLKALERSLVRETTRLQVNRQELEKIQASNKLTDAERA